MPRHLRDDPRYEEIISRSARYEAVTGQQGFLYPSEPGEGEPARFVFGDVVRLGIGAALRYARLLGAYAEQREREAAAAAALRQQYEQMKDIT